MEVYNFHTKTNNPDYVWVNTKEKTFSAIINRSKKEAQKVETKSINWKKILFPIVQIDVSPAAKIKPTNGWLNLIRKIIDILDKEFPNK